MTALDAANLAVAVEAALTLLALAGLIAYAFGPEAWAVAVERRLIVRHASRRRPGVSDGVWRLQMWLAHTEAMRGQR